MLTPIITVLEFFRSLFDALPAPVRYSILAVFGIVAFVGFLSILQDK